MGGVLVLGRDRGELSRSAGLDTGPTGAFEGIDGGAIGDGAIGASDDGGIDPGASDGGV